MTVIRRIALGCAMAAVFVGCAVGTALANGGIRIGEAEVGESLTLSSLTIATTGATVVCPVTLSGSLDAAIPKEAEALIGEVTSTRVGSCSGGEMTLLSGTLPWMFQYQSFQGTLPNIAGITAGIKEIAALGTAVVLGLTVRCLYRGRARGIFNGTEMTQFRFEEATTIPLSVSLSGICPETITLRGTGSLSTRVRMSLLAAESNTIIYTAPTFPNTPAGREVSANLRIENDRNRNLRVERVQIVGAGATAFIVPSNGIIIPANRTSLLAIRFRPPAAMVYNATVQFLNLSGAVIASINITGTGT